MIHFWRDFYHRITINRTFQQKGQKLIIYLDKYFITRWTCSRGKSGPKPRISQFRMKSHSISFMTLTEKSDGGQWEPGKRWNSHTGQKAGVPVKEREKRHESRQPMNLMKWTISPCITRCMRNFRIRVRLRLSSWIVRVSCRNRSINTLGKRMNIFQDRWAHFLIPCWSMIRLESHLTIIRIWFSGREPKKKMSP